MELEQLKAILESLLFAAGEPVPLARLVAALEDVPREEVRQALTELSADYNRESRGVMLVEVAGGYQLRTAKEHAAYVRKLLATRPPRLSRPIMETLAIIAYRQPITRPEIEQLRGVDSGAVLETLLERSLVRIVGRKEAPGRPQLYATTPDFLETFGLKDLDALPDLGELREVEQQIEDAGYQRTAQPEERFARPDGAERRDTGIAMAGEPAAASPESPEGAPTPAAHSIDEPIGGDVHSATRASESTESSMLGDTESAPSGSSEAAGTPEISVTPPAERESDASGAASIDTGGLSPAPSERDDDSKE